jgi:hypothetical protein
MPRFSVCAEIGVWKGDFSAQILGKVQPASLHLIDPWKVEPDEIYSQAIYGSRSNNQEQMDALYQTVTERFKREVRSGVVTIHRASSSEACALFDEDYFDWIYIDGNHLYEFVKQDITMYYPKLKRGGYITGDDYVDGGWWQGGVKKAVDELISTGLCTKMVTASNQFILKKR